MEERFVKQVEFLLRVAPEISRIEEFALHGGTAIEEFILDSSPIGTPANSMGQRPM